MRMLLNWFSTLKHLIHVSLTSHSMKAVVRNGRHWLWLKAKREMWSICLALSLFLAVWYEFEQRDGKSFLLTCVSALARLRERTGLSHKRVWPCRVYVSLSVKHDSCFQTDWERWKNKRRERENRASALFGVCWIHPILLAGAHTTCSKIPITNTLSSYQSFTIPHIIHLICHYQKKKKKCFTQLQTWYMG